MATTRIIKKKNQQNQAVKRNKQWVMDNPRVARRSVEESDNYEIEVFGYNHKEVAEDLHKALLSSGFLDKYGLFRVQIEPM